MVPEKLVVQLRGRAETCQSTRAGTYILQSTDVNGKKHWLAENSNNAIWYLAESQSECARWRIGLKKNIGKDVGGLLSPDNTATPQKATTWKYLNKKGVRWYPVMSDSKNAVIVTCCDGKN